MIFIFLTYSYNQHQTINKFILSTFPILSGDVSFGGNTAQFLKSPNYPLYLSKSLSQDAQLQDNGFFTNNESYSFEPSPSNIINI